MVALSEHCSGALINTLAVQKQKNGGRAAEAFQLISSSNPRLEDRLLLSNQQSCSLCLPVLLALDNVAYLETLTGVSIKEKVMQLRH